MNDKIVTPIPKGDSTTKFFFIPIALLSLCLVILPTSLFADPQAREPADTENAAEMSSEAEAASPANTENATPGPEENALPPAAETALESETAFITTPSADLEQEPPLEPLPPLKWLFVINPLVGWLHNETSPTITSKTAGGEDTTRKVTFAGSGWGAGLVLTGFYRFKYVTLQAVNISYLFPDVNSSIMWGNITQVINSFNLPTFIDPYVAFSFAYIGTRSELSNYVYSVHDTRSDGTPTVGYAYFPKFKVNTRNFQISPRVGLTFKIPIQNWRIRPYYEYLHEDLNAHAKTAGSKVNVFARESGYQTDEIDLSFNGKTNTIYKSHVVGLSFGIDYHSFLQLYGNVAYNISHNLLSARFMGTVLLPRHWGFSVTYEHQEMVMTKNDFVMFGPTFFFMPPKFMDRIVQMKDEAMEKRRQEKEEEARKAAE